MCAICGIVNFDHSHRVDRSVVEAMTQTLAHRGPDGAGYFVEGGTGLGHRRLSIIDLEGGWQPIYNEDRSAVIVFNGEIYNYRELAERLTKAGHVFRTRSDTETILHAYEEYGDDCVDHLRGMFTFAIWDRVRRRILLARDRLGVKPLYYYSDGRFLAFASEIKALLDVPGIPRELDAEALDLYLSLRYVPGPRTMFKNISRLQPGHVLTADAGGVRVRKYWDIEYRSTGTGGVERFRELLDESVELRLISEVPLGVFLSGGLDSTAILATMSRLAGEGRVKTFSVGYETGAGDDEEANEFEYARLAAGTFGCDHHEYRLTAREFESFIPDLVWYLDEPLADPTCIPLYYISKLAREFITVVLSGEGADEILGGYGIYSKMLALDRINSRAPGIGRLARLTPWEKLRGYVRMCGQPLEERYRGVCRAFNSEGLRRLIGATRFAEAEFRQDEIFGSHFAAARRASPLNRMLYVDAKVWLPDDLLMKADRMSMANGLELRVPFLDHRLVEFAATLPETAKRGKALLRDAVRGTVPDAIIDRPKKGFPVPIASWLRSPLREFTRDHLLGSGSACSFYVERGEALRLIQEHETGAADRSQEIWTLLVLEFWHRTFARGIRGERPVAAAI